MSQIKAWAGLMSEEGFAMHFPDVATSSGGDEGWNHIWQKSRRSEGAKIAPSRPLKVSIYSWVRELSECETTHSLSHLLRSHPMTLWKIVETLGGERPRMGSRLLRVSPLPISFLCSCTMRWTSSPWTCYSLWDILFQPWPKVVELGMFRLKPLMLWAKMNLPSISLFLKYCVTEMEKSKPRVFWHSHFPRASTW